MRKTAIIISSKVIIYALNVRNAPSNIFSTIFDDIRQDGSDYCEDHRDHDSVVLLSC